jgi:methylmalonyl-CoA mutase C-terminal domain/subunit
VAGAAGVLVRGIRRIRGIRGSVKKTAKKKAEGAAEAKPPRKFRVLVAKPGLDGHDRGAKVVAAALRDGGFEVIYTGLHQTCENIVNAALQEDVDAVCVSILSGAHMTIFPEILGLMKKKGMKDVLLCGGGIIPEDDAKKLGKMGVGRLFGPGADTREIIAYLSTEIPRVRKD